MANLGGMTAAGVRDPRRWAVTLGGLAIYGLGSRLWLPGLDPGAATGLPIPLHPANFSLFSVGVRPILFGLALAEIARVSMPPLARWAAASRDHSELLWRAARAFALALAAVQAMGIARAIERFGDIAPFPGTMFRLEIVAAIVGATALLIWLAGVMTARGVGDGLLILFAAPFVAHFPYDVANAFNSVRVGLVPAWAPQALVALAVAAFALLLASARRAGGARGLDIWPPLMGTIVFQFLGLAAQAADFLSQGQLSAVADALPPAIRLLVLVAVQGALIWLFAVWRGRAEGADAAPLAAEILVCSGALMLFLLLNFGGPLSGCWIILTVAAGLSLASGKAQADGGLSGPTPTA